MISQSHFVPNETGLEKWVLKSYFVIFFLILLVVTNPEKRHIDAYTILICLYAYQCCVRTCACMCNVIVNWNTVSNTYNTIEKRRHYSQQRCANPPNLKTVNRKTKNYWALACPTSVSVVLQYIVCLCLFCVSAWLGQHGRQLVIFLRTGRDSEGDASRKAKIRFYRRPGGSAWKYSGDRWPPVPTALRSLSLFVSRATFWCLAYKPFKDVLRSFHRHSFHGCWHTTVSYNSF